MTKIKEHPATFRTRCVTAGKAPALPPVANVVTDLHAETECLHGILHKSLEGWMIPHHEAGDGSVGDRLCGLEKGLKPRGSEGQRLLDIDRRAGTRAQFDQLEPHICRSGNDCARCLPQFLLKAFGVQSTPWEKRAVRPQRLDVFVVASPDRAASDNNVTSSHLHSFPNQCRLNWQEGLVSDASKARAGSHRIFSVKHRDGSHERT